MFNFLKKTLYFFLSAGLLLALLRVFNMDVLGIVSWVFNLGWQIIDYIANFFTGSETFQAVTKS